MVALSNKCKTQQQTGYANKSKTQPHVGKHNKKSQNTTNKKGGRNRLYTANITEPNDWWVVVRSPTNKPHYSTRKKSSLQPERVSACKIHLHVICSLNLQSGTYILQSPCMLSYSSPVGWTNRASYSASCE